jgi:glutamate---cysteine ligase / carboxylate-amine ligase
VAQAPGRAVGVEEELLLVDPLTCRALGVAPGVLPVATELAHSEAPAGVGKELMREQVETGSVPVTDLTELRADLLRLRRAASDAAAVSGSAVVALGTSPLPGRPSATPDKRYQRMYAEYGLTAREHLVCGCHVHVAVESRDEGVAVLDRLRPWLSVLLALSGNSPYWQGEDSGYASYRSRVMGRWPSAGPTEPYGDAAGYDRAIEALIDSGVVFDHGMIYFDARLSNRYPTVEVRVADVCLSVDHTVLVAALARALVSSASAAWRAGKQVPAVRTDLVRVANWRAARSGIDADLVDVLEARPVPARQLVSRLIEHLGPALEEAGDLDSVRDLIEDVWRHGTGAGRQRSTYRRRQRLEDVVEDAMDQTLVGGES